MKPDMFSEKSNDFSPSFALLIIPPIRSGAEHTIALEATMQSLVLDRRHPIALELAGTAELRSFIVRATSQDALDHVEVLLRAQYPQSEIRPLKAHEDPFRLDPEEAVTAVELVAGTASFLPLRTWQEAQKEGTDPLLGLLAALSRIPEHTRVIAQLSLIPASNDWSRRNLRRAVENPLEPERRAKEQQRMIALFSDGSSNLIIMNLGILIGLLFLARPYTPGWVWISIIKIIIGQGSQVSAAHISQIILYIGGILLLEGVIILLYVVIHSLYRRQALYDPNIVSQKTSRMAYRTRLRLYVIGPKTNRSVQSVVQRFSDTKVQANARKMLLLRVVAAYRQFHMANGAYFTPRRISSLEAARLFAINAMGHSGWQKGLNSSRHMISVDALASLWHMPHPQALPELALVEHRRSRTLLIPPAVTQQCRGLSPIGYSEHAGYRLPFALTPEFFSYHTLITGKAGEGKSIFMQHIVREAMRLGGMVLIDPFGQLCEDVLQLVPPERAEDVVFIDLSDTIASVGLNPLDVTLGHRSDKFIADLLKMLAQIWASSWTARMENAFEMSLRTLFEANKVLVARDAQRGPNAQYTLLDILPLLTNANFCHTLLQQIPDDYLHRWWREYYEPLSLAQQRDVINPIAAKVAKFESVIARRILGQNVSTINIPQMIGERKIILFKLARGLVGNDVASMIGATLLGLIQNTLEQQRHGEYVGTTHLPIIIDEFQRVAGADYRMLSELRKYGATFFMATQSLDYLQKINVLLWPTLQANVRQIAAFNMSAQDAGLLHSELGVDQEDILHLDINICYVSVLAAGRRQTTFSLKLDPPSTVNAELAESIRARCRVRYTCSIAEVDKRLSESMLRSIRIAPQPDSHLPQQSPAPTGSVARGESVSPLTLALPFEQQFDSSSPTSSFTPLAEGEGAEYHKHRERDGRSEISPMLAGYQMRRDEWSNQEDINSMGNASLISSDVLRAGLSNEVLEELEMMEVNAYNVMEEDSDDQHEQEDEGEILRDDIYGNKE